MGNDWMSKVSGPSHQNMSSLQPIEVEETSCRSGGTENGPVTHQNFSPAVSEWDRVVPNGGTENGPSFIHRSGGTENATFLLGPLLALSTGNRSIVVGGRSEPKQISVSVSTAVASAGLFAPKAMLGTGGELVLSTNPPPPTTVVPVSTAAPKQLDIMGRTTLVAGAAVATGLLALKVAAIAASALCGPGAPACAIGAATLVP